MSRIIYDQIKLSKQEAEKTAWKIKQHPDTTAGCSARPSGEIHHQTPPASQQRAGDNTRGCSGTARLGAGGGGRGQGALGPGSPRLNGPVPAGRALRWGGR